LGIALVPRYAVVDDLDAGRLETVLPQYKVGARTLLAVYPRTRVTPRKVAAFVEFLKDWMAQYDFGDRPAARRRVAG
jgi:DNA-binding transcriptional LysR family regulator